MKTILLLASALFVVQSAGALTLKEKKKFEDWKTYQSAGHGHAKSFTTNCGYDMPVTIDEKMVTPFMEANTHAGAYCDAPVSAMSGMCKDATSKAAISSKIKSVKCMIGPKDQVAMKINGSVFEMSVGPGAPNLDQKVKEFLENNL